MSDKKRPFQILDEMNVEDIQNHTGTVSICNYLLSAEKVKNGARVSMGATESALFDIISGKVIPLLMLVDKEVYLKKKEQPATDHAPIAFANWLAKNFWGYHGRIGNDAIWNQPPGTKWGDGEKKTTTELFEVFKNKKQ